MNTEIITGPDQANPEDTAVALINPPAAWLDVLAERQRQVSEENHLPDYDDQYHRGELPLAGAAYAYYASTSLRHAEAMRLKQRHEAPPFWPWSAHWWKPTMPRRMLVKAAALILAEIERIDRAIARTQQEQP